MDLMNPYHALFKRWCLITLVLPPCMQAQRAPWGLSGLEGPLVLSTGGSS